MIKSINMSVCTNGIESGTQEVTSKYLLQESMNDYYVNFLAMTRKTVILNV